MTVTKFGAIDVGTNSIRLLVVAIDARDHSFTVIHDIKETARLGEGEFLHNRITPEAMDRAVTVISHFVEVARGYEVGEIRVVATSAVREADNQQEFLDCVRESCGLEVEVISGKEEARLIYLGVLAGATLQGKQALFIDVGGGSTELVIGDRQQYYLLESLKLGTIRLTNRFLGDGRAAVSRKKYAQLQEYIRGVAVHAARKIHNLGFELVLCSSGTAINLGEMVAAMLGEKPTSIRQYPVRLDDITRVREMLCKAPYDERRKLPGIKPERADIMVAGVAVIETILEQVGAQQMHVADYALREGLVVDHIIRDEQAREHFTAVSPRKRSVLQLARSCGYEAEHAEQIRHLCLSLFDQLWELGLHRMNRHDRELLEYGAYLHDVGFFISHTNHHQHAYYLIRHSELLGFNDREQAILANLALYHRKSTPKKKHAGFMALDSQARSLVEKLSCLLRIAEGLDRSHLSLVRNITLERDDNGVKMTIDSASDCQLELWGVESQLGVFRSVFGAAMSVSVHHEADSGASDSRTEDVTGREADKVSLTLPERSSE
ncbi:MAG: Ppx/GppA family phosphatase [Armatimonadetes bacterium]|nr:Ppx/GppA family phosphatase [Armatimonadota bacterium]